MRFLFGFVSAIVVVIIIAALAAGTYDVAASAPDTALEFEIMHSITRNSVRMRAGDEERQTWTEAELRNGFQDYNEMCVVCHAAPGKERTPTSKGMRPQPPLLAEASKQWTNAQLFRIVKNGVKMTGMPAFGPTHSDEKIWNLVGFIRRLPQISPDEFSTMEKNYGGGEQEQHLH